MNEYAWLANHRFGMLVDMSLSAVPAWSPVGTSASWYQAHLEGPVPGAFHAPSPFVEAIDYHQRTWPLVDDYAGFAGHLDFEALDPSEVSAVARRAGMTYALITAKHHDGFCWWNAPATQYSSVERGPRRDVFGDLVAAARADGLVTGASYSLLDWADPRYPSTAYVDEVVHPQVIDLVQRYDVDLLWGDGSWGAGNTHWRSDELIHSVRRSRPNLVINDRWWTDLDAIRTFNYHLPPAVLDEPWEARRSLGMGYGVNRAEPTPALMTPAQLIALLTEVVAKGGRLLVSMAVDRHGKLNPQHVEVLDAVGVWVQQHRELIETGTPWKHWGNDDVRFIELDNKLHVVDVNTDGIIRGLETVLERIRNVTCNGADVEFDVCGDELHVYPPRWPRPEFPAVYTLMLAPRTLPALPLFATETPQPILLDQLLRDAAPGSIVHLGDGEYLGPATIPTGVTVRGLGPDRTRIVSPMVNAVSLDADSRLEHCQVAHTVERVAWVAHPVVHARGPRSVVFGCCIDGHLRVSANDVRVSASTLSGVFVQSADHCEVSRNTLVGMNWDHGVEIVGGHDHIIDTNRFQHFKTGVLLDTTTNATIAGNQFRCRWWGVVAQNTTNSTIRANSCKGATRAVDIDGGSGAHVVGNSASLGDSGCLVQGEASNIRVTGNHWEQCRVGLFSAQSTEIEHRDNIAVDLGEDDGAYRASLAYPAAGF